MNGTGTRRQFIRVTKADFKTAAALRLGDDGDDAADPLHCPRIDASWSGGMIGCLRLSCCSKTTATT
jgi:hypothetical protein